MQATMSRLASLLRLPRWLERAWQAAVMDPKNLPRRPDPLEAETPLPPASWLDRRR